MIADPDNPGELIPIPELSAPDGGPPLRDARTRQVIAEEARNEIARLTETPARELIEIVQDASQSWLRRATAQRMLAATRGGKGARFDYKLISERVLGTPMQSVEIAVTQQRVILDPDQIPLSVLVQVAAGQLPVIPATAEIVQEQQEAAPEAPEQLEKAPEMQQVAKTAL